jgi:secreted PhoX family phosphatase
MLQKKSYRLLRTSAAISAAILSSSLLLVSCGDDGDDGKDGADGAPGEDGQDLTARPFTISFSQLSLPETAAEQAQKRASAEVTVDETTYADGANTIVATNQSLPSLGGSGSVVYGTWKKGDGSDFTDGADPVVCTNGSGPDYTSLIEFNQFGQSTLFAITNMECSVGGAWITKLDQDSANGELTAVSARPVDFSEVYGTYVNCAGMTTPWGTHLGSEEYEPPMAAFNAAATAYASSPVWSGQENMQWFDDETWHDEHMLAIAEYNGLTNDAANAANFGYYYGWVPEIEITSADGDHNVMKHFSMGRFAHELSYVMPDNRTVYQSDDGANTGLFLYVADNEKDLSSGTRYAARWDQISGAGAGEAFISWVSLGHSDDATIRSAIDAGVTFSDLFAQETPNEDGTCPTDGFRSVNAYDHGLVCVQLNTDTFNGTEISQLASRLETRLYAGYLGATTEFRKEEGITFNPDDNILYVAMSELERGMMDNDSRYDLGGPNHIRLAGDDNECGAVYGLDVADGTVEDTDGALINSQYVVETMYGVVVGTEVVEDGCTPDGISNPDNITYLPQYGQLVIGEDSGASGDGSNSGYFDRDLGNFIWAFDVNTETLTRIASTPAGSETTSPYWNADVNGWGYLMMVNQHPDGAESDVGYVGPFPQLD